LASAFNLGAFLQKPDLKAIAAIGDKFTIKSDKGRRLFYEMLNDSDKDFMQFGAKEILNRKPPQFDTSIIRVHGTKERLFPISKVKNPIPIEDGNHFMIFEKRATIEKIILSEFSN
jgi:hypothetical protein